MKNEERVGHLNFSFGCNFFHSPFYVGLKHTIRQFNPIFPALSTPVEQITPNIKHMVLVAVETPGQVLGAVEDKYLTSLVCPVVNLFPPTQALIMRKQAAN